MAGSFGGVCMRNKAFDGFQIWGVRRANPGLWLNDIAWGAIHVAKLMTYPECQAVVDANPDVDIEIVRLLWQ